MEGDFEWDCLTAHVTITDCGLMVLEEWGLSFYRWLSNDKGP